LNSDAFWGNVWMLGMEEYWDGTTVAMLDEIGRRNPLPNVWLGVSVENQDAADERIAHLLRTPAAVRFLSGEPLLGPGHFRQVPEFNRVGLSLRDWWVIVGGESGPGARPLNVAWIRSIVQQCRTAR